MAVKSFSFASPGVFLNEVDQSQIAKQPAPVGPVIIGRALRGPGMRPVTVASYDEFVSTFGDPVAGGDSSGDAWRSGVPSAPTYGPYAAQAWLANSPTLTYLRLLGVESDNASDAGQAGWMLPTTVARSGSHGLFVFASGTTGALTGTLAAVFYCTGTVPVLSGTIVGTSSSISANGAFINALSGVFTVQMTGGVGVDGSIKKSFTFNPSDGTFIRKVFNTNPVNANTGKGGVGNDPSTAQSLHGYWLGESFENDILTNVTGAASIASLTSNMLGIILPLNGYSDRTQDAQEANAARTGWFVSQAAQGTVAGYDPATTVNKLFRFIGLDAGEWLKNNLKVTINNISPPQNAAQLYGTFDVELRQIGDTDANVKLVESFTNCTLDPSSPNYIARKIGDVHYTWESTERKLERQGLYPNNSKYIRVEMYSDAIDSSLLPFGILGPLKPKSDATGSYAAIVASGSTLLAVVTTASAEGFNSAQSTGSSNATYSFIFPSSRQRLLTSEDSLSNFKLASFGSATTRNASSLLLNDDLKDITKLPPIGGAEFTNGVASTSLEYSWKFSLDEVAFVSGSNSVYSYAAGSKAAGTSFTATSSGGTFATLLNNGVNSFTTVFQGGTDGFNVMENEPLRNSLMTSNSTEDDSYVYNTYKRAIDSVRDPEIVQANILSIPGLTFEGLTLYAVQAAESRKDCLAVIDIASGDGVTPTYVTKQEDNSTTIVRSKTVDEVVTEIKNRNFNSSYGATYYPWLQIVDSLSGKIVAIPPSIVAIGAMSYTDKVQAPWFAPAGFNRGGLSTGNAGVNVVNVVKKLNQADRDKLYVVNINPITSFPNEGIVIFGQKTLQATPSALDRINVRRLMLYIERGIDIISKSILFEPNVEDTWNNFKDKAEPLLADVKSRFGLTDYKLILDTTTTTPDLIDQNILYAKIFVKPARAIEFVAIDFFITRSGASFGA